MKRMLLAAIALGALSGCVAYPAYPPGYGYAYAPAYGYAPGYAYAPAYGSVSIGVGGGYHHWR